MTPTQCGLLSLQETKRRIHDVAREELRPCKAKQSEDTNQLTPAPAAHDVLTHQDDEDEGQREEETRDQLWDRGCDNEQTSEHGAVQVSRAGRARDASGCTPRTVLPGEAGHAAR